MCNNYFSFVRKFPVALLVITSIIFSILPWSCNVFSYCSLVMGNQLNRLAVFVMFNDDPTCSNESPYSSIRDLILFLSKLSYPYT